MIKNYFLLFILTCYVDCYSQYLEFSYDASGNQIKRELKTLVLNSTMSTTNVEETQSYEDLIQLMDIEYYPNPVEDLLNIRWNPDLELLSMYLYSTKGQLLQTHKISKGQEYQIMDLSTYATGMYHLIIFQANKKAKTYKVIKK